MTKKFLHILAAMSLFAGVSMFAAGCGDNDKEEAEGESKVPGQLNTPEAKSQQTATNNSKCEKLKGNTDFSITNTNDIINYLVAHCKLSEYYQFPTFQDNKGKVGDPCFCYGNDCEMAGYQRPEVEKIYGCGDLPANYNGAVKGCFRSTDVTSSGIYPSLYFPNGMCAMMMSKCHDAVQPGCLNEHSEDECRFGKSELVNGKTETTIYAADCAKGECELLKDPEGKKSYICGFAEFGDWSKHDTFTKCPGEGQVLADFNMPIAIYVGTTLSSAAMLEARTCFQQCENDSDCHGSSEFDAIIGEQGKIKCIDTTNTCKSADYEGKIQGTKVCFDQRVIDQSAIGLCTIKPAE